MSAENERREDGREGGATSLQGLGLGPAPTLLSCTAGGPVSPGHKGAVGINSLCLWLQTHFIPLPQRHLQEVPQCCWSHGFWDCLPLTCIVSTMMQKALDMREDGESKVPTQLLGGKQGAPAGRGKWSREERGR